MQCDASHIGDFFFLKFPHVTTSSEVSMTYLLLIQKQKLLWTAKWDISAF